MKLLNSIKKDFLYWNGLKRKYRKENTRKLFNHLYASENYCEARAKSFAELYVGLKRGKYEDVQIMH